MAYVTYSTEVKNIINSLASYPMVTFEPRVDNTAYTVIRYTNGNIFERDFTSKDLKMSAQDMAEFIIRCVESYFNGWAVRKGLVIR